ncbi:MAG: hypothetical protein PHH70_04150 [Candidatus Gracilibacteria bacterium]|nr:hypothetical protein [Candidatus Gracilibacteria bacterium]
MHPFPFESLLTWFDIHGRHTLPWRAYFHLSDKDLSYRVWLSEILLQQTQVDRVTGYYENILKRFPTIESLASASYEEFFPYYQGLGYYSRARNMLATATIVTKEYGGVFPKNTEHLDRLPGVGPYTRAAIQAFVYDIPVLSFDTNLEKVFSRYYYGTRFHKLAKHEKTQIEKDFQTTGLSGRSINAAFMDFGSLVSLNNTPVRTSPGEHHPVFDMSTYPLSGCKWFETRGIQEISEKKQKHIFPTKDAQILVTLHQNHTLYYSSDTKVYLPFLLPPTEGDIRHSVQSYFRGQYGLEVSVRPPHAKYFQDDQPFVACNAQIQNGNNIFPVYPKNDRGMHEGKILA